MLIGSHVSMSGKKMLLGAAKEAASYQTIYVYDLYRSSAKHAAQTDRRDADRSRTKFYDGKRNFEYRRPCSLHY